MLQEIRKLIDFEMLKPDFLIKMIAPDFDLKEFLTGISKMEKAKENEGGDTKEGEEEDDQLPSNLESSGVGSDNIIDNLSQYLMVLILFIVFVLLLGIAGVICRTQKEKINKKLKDLYKKTVWNGFIRSISMSYLNLCITIVVGFMVMVEKPSSMTTAKVCSTAGLASFCLSYFFVCLWFLIKNRDRLEDQEVKD